jgi:addiction module HigA family antidote
MLKKPVHPGQRLRKECFEPRGLTVTEVAKQLGVTRQALNNILNGKAGVSSQMAVRLAVFFGLRPETVQQWQKDYELSQARSGHAQRSRARGHSFLLSSNDLVVWAETIDARYALPLLLRALVRVTAESASIVDFPAMEDTQRPGWDGVVENPARSAYVPIGRSVWELSTDARPLAKVERDYQKRTLNPLGYQPAKATLVMVTLRRWAQKKQWASAKEQEGQWARVVAYDATDLEQWLELAPEIAIWLAMRIGRRPAGVKALENFWNEFSASTAPPIGPALLLAGRGPAADRVAEWLSSGSGVFRVLGDSWDEALAFMAAVAVTRSDGPLNNALTDTIVIGDAEQARQLMATPRRLTFVWQIDDPSLLGTLIDKGHRAFVPVSRSTAGAEHADVELPRLNRAEFVAAIKDTLSGLDDEKRDDEANARARESGRSITVYMRRYATAGLARTPSWANPKEAGELIPVLLAGGWNESNEADKSALSALAGCDYLSISRLLARCRNQPDSPIRRIGDTWTLVAPLDAWSLLARFITDVELDRYRQIVLQVLGEADPALEVEPGKRWLAKLYDKERKHSDALRRGLADSLILLAVIGDKASTQTSGRLKCFCDALVYELIGREPNGRKWSSLFDHLPSLAEAAPESFLRALEDSLATTNPSVMALFEVEERPLGGGARHPYLLWALELLAWDTDYMPRSARLLAKLSRLDPGGNLGNRPMHSLVAIFCCWHPNTVASLDDRLKAIDSLLAREPEIAWSMLLELLPTEHGVGHTSAEPRWRPKSERVSLTWGDLWRAYEQIISRALKAAQLRCDRLCQLVDRIGTWSPEQRSRFFQQLREFVRTCKAPAERLALWQEIRGFVSHGRTYHFFEEADLQPLDELLESLDSGNALERHSWLFDDDFPNLTRPKTISTVENMGIDQRMKEVNLARLAAASEIMQEHGVDGIIELAKRVKLPVLVGSAAAETVPSGPLEREVLERTLAVDDERLSRAGVSFVWRRSETQGSDWSDQVLHSDSFKSWAAAKQAAFCLGLPEGHTTWRIVTALGQAVETKYWEQVPVWVGRLSRNEDAEFAVRRLLETPGRSLNALDQAGSYPDRLSAELLVRVLESAIGELVKLKTLHVGTANHDVQCILARLRNGQELSQSELGRLELQYLPLLRPLHRPVTLYKSLQADPELFADVVTHAFKGDGGDSDSSEAVDVSENEATVRNRARLAWDLLSEWDSVPGTQSDGRLSSDALKDWCARARAACAAKRRSRVGDIQIGHVLAYAVPDADGIWPPVAVRELIEDTESPDLESGLRSGRIKQRGVWAKSPSDGGRPERELAKQYRIAAKTVNSHWQRTARLLYSLADVYEGFGRHDDISAEKLDLL